MAENDFIFLKEGKAGKGRGEKEESKEGEAVANTRETIFDPHCLKYLISGPFRKCLLIPKALSNVFSDGVIDRTANTARMLSTYSISSQKQSRYYSNTGSCPVIPFLLYIQF